MKLIKVPVRYINKEGVEKKAYNFYLEFDNGQRVQVMDVSIQKNCEKMFFQMIMLNYRLLPKLLKSRCYL